MRLHISACFVIGAFLAGAAAPLHAQSLAELARKEEERRKATAKDPKAPKPKVYRNDDVGNVPAPLPQTAVTPADGTKPADPNAKPADSPSTEKPADAAGPATAEAAPAGVPPAGGAKDQAYWSGRAKQLQTQLDRDRQYVEALQTRVNSLTTDFVNADDPARRSVIEADRRRTLEELDRLKKSIVEQQKGIADFEEEARRNGVPPGWLR